MYPNLRDHPQFRKKRGDCVPEKPGQCQRDSFPCGEAQNENKKPQPWPGVVESQAGVKAATHRETTLAGSRSRQAPPSLDSRKLLALRPDRGLVLTLDLLSEGGHDMHFSVEARPGSSRSPALRVFSRTGR
jgi:hypothetical protein